MLLPDRKNTSIATWAIMILLVSPIIFTSSAHDPRWAAKRKRMSHKVRDMFYHAYDNYLRYAFPAITGEILIPRHKIRSDFVTLSHPFIGFHLMQNRMMHLPYLLPFIYKIQLDFTNVFHISQLSLHLIKMSSGNRSQSYSVEEDIQLCHVYLDISQNPIVGINQSKDQFWSRVELAYQSDDKFQTPFRPANSLRKRMQIINTAVSKLRGCVRQIERMNPSGASNEDILKRAHMLLAEDPLYRKGFKFDHVWHILKDCEKFSDPTPTPNRTQIPTPESSYQRPSSTDEDIGANLSSFAINSTDEETGATSSKRPVGIKKAKGKRKHDEGITKIIQQNNVLVDLIKKRNDDAERKLYLAEYKEENKILLKDLNSISDPNLQDFIRGEQIRIMQKRTQQQGSTTQNRGNEDEGQGSQNNSYGQYFDYLGGNKNNLSD